MLKNIKTAFLISAILLLFASLLWASGKCPKCLKTWNQPWAIDFKVCPECGTPLVQIEKKQDTDSETVREIFISRVEKEFSTIYRRRLALCIGINKYIHFPVLEYAVSDAQSMAGVMKGYGFDDWISKDCVFFYAKINPYQAKREEIEAKINETRP